MAEIISCAKDTQLHSFPGLEQLATSAHVTSNSSYCQFFGSSKLFVRTNKDWGIELLRIKQGSEPSDGESTQRTVDMAERKQNGPGRTIANVKKIVIDNVYCVACPKTAGKDEIAIGLTTGTVRFMNYKKASFTKRFDADRIANGVVTFMDFNATDDFLATVYENGLVNVYGMKTGSKLRTLTFDENTTKARFHPTKRFSMAVASYKGGVLVYDTQSKKTVFSQPSAHRSPCRDVAMVETFPDNLFSVGYDGVINIFDTRKRETASHIQSNYPFESLAIAESGQHFAVGNLKGFVYGYDLRNLKDPLTMQKIHQSCVNSVVFVPQPREGSTRRSMIEFDETKKSIKSVRISEGGQTNRLDRMSLQEEQTPGGQEHHDSFMGEIDIFLQRRDAPLDCLSRLSLESRTSMQMAGNNLMGFLEDLSDCNMDRAEADGHGMEDRSEQQHLTTSGAESEPSVDDSFVNTDRLLKRLKSDPTRSNTSTGRTFRRGHGVGTDNLENIREEGSEIGEGMGETDPANKSISSSTNGNGDSVPVSPRILVSSQHENTASPLAEAKRRSSSETRTLMDGKADRESRKHLSLASIKQEEYFATPEPPGLAAAPSGARKKNHSTPRTDPGTDESTVRSDIAELHKAMRKQFEESTLRQVEAEQAMSSHLWMCMFNLWRQTQNKLESLEQYVSTGLGLLIPRDEFAQQYLSMRAENDALRTRIKELEENGKR